MSLVCQRELGLWGDRGVWGSGLTAVPEALKEGWQEKTASPLRRCISLAFITNKTPFPGPLVFCLLRAGLRPTYWEATWGATPAPGSQLGLRVGS